MLLCSLNFLQNFSGIGHRCNICVIVSVDVLQFMHVSDRQGHIGKQFYFLLIYIM